MKNSKIRLILFRILTYFGQFSKFIFHKRICLQKSKMGYDRICNLWKRTFGL